MLKYLILSLLLSNCAFFTNKEGPKLEYMNSQNNSDSLERVEKNLIKKATNAGKRYHLTVLPLSSLILNKRELSKLSLPKQRVCFEVTLRIDTQKNESLKKFWKGKIINTKKEESNLTWLHPAQDNIKESLIKGPYGRQKRWNQKGIMCTHNTYDFSHNFKVILSSKTAPFPYTKDMIFKWDFLHYEIKKGKKVKARKIYQKKRYRDW